MANTAINHDPAATFPGSSTDIAVVKWSGTGGKTLANSGVTIDASNNVIIPGSLHLTGDEKELRFYEGANFISIAAPSGLGADYTLTLPLNDGSPNEFLQTNGSGVLVWAAPAAIADDSIVEAKLDVSNGPTNGLFLQAQSGEGGGLTWAAAGGTAVAGTTDNGLLTFVNSGSTFAAESTLTYTGNYLSLQGAADDATSSGIHWGTSADTTLGTLTYDTLEGQFVLMVNNQTNVLQITNSDFSIRSGSSLTSVTAGVCKAWSRTGSWPGSGNFTILGSFNVVSIADNGNGLFTHTWDTDFASANTYVNGGWGSEGRVIGPSTNASQSVGSSINTAIISDSGSRTDSDPIMFVAFGDQ